MSRLPLWSSSADCTLEVASQLAAAQGLRGTRPEHFLLALCRESRSDRLTRAYQADLARRSPRSVEAFQADLGCLQHVFREARVSVPTLEAALGRVPDGRGVPEHESTVHRSPDARLVCRAAMRHCLDHHYPYLRAVHLLGALAEIQPGTVAACLTEAGIAPRRLAGAAWKVGEWGCHLPQPTLPTVATPVLDSLLRRDLRLRHTQEALRPFLGREMELNELAERLCMGSGACVLLHGPPGSGRTALVEALSARVFWEGATYGAPAPRIVEPCPEALASLPAAAAAELAAELADRNLILLLDPLEPFLEPNRLTLPGPATLYAALHARTVRCIGITTPDSVVNLRAPGSRPHWRPLPLKRMSPVDLEELLHLWRGTLETRHNTELDRARFAHLLELCGREHLLPGEILALLRRELEPCAAPGPG